MLKTVSCSAILVLTAFTVQASDSGVQVPATDHSVFENVRVLPMNGQPIIPSARVVVRNDRIITVEAMSDGASPAGATVIDGSGKTITPA